MCNLGALTPVKLDPPPKKKEKPKQTNDTFLQLWTWPPSLQPNVHQNDSELDKLLFETVHKAQTLQQSFATKRQFS